MNPPFRAEHIGSFIRPPELLRARGEHAGGRLSDGELRAAEDAAIRDFVETQRRLGFRMATDGEFRRSTYTANFTTSGLTGVVAEQTGEGEWSYQDASGHKERGRLPAVNARIRWNASRNADEFSFLKSVAGATPKITLPGPCYIHFKLAEAGCRYVQLDETSIAKLGDPKIRNALAARGDEWEALLDTYIATINAIVRRAPKHMRIGMHLCRGNRMGHWQAEGGYDLVAEKVFRDLAIDFFFLEYDSERAGTFEPLKSVPAHKSIVLGLVSTKVPELESMERLEARIRDCARYIGLDRLGISPQCGFSSSDKSNKIMSVERATEKLALVVDVARKVWGD